MKAVDRADRALDDIAEKTPGESATADELVSFARDNAKTLDQVAKSTRGTEVTRSDLVELKDGVAQLAALTSKGAGELADALEALGKRQAALQELEDRANAHHEEVGKLIAALEKECPKPRCGKLHGALAVLDEPLPAVIDVDSAARSTRELANRFAQVTRAADGEKTDSKELVLKLSKASEAARTGYTLLSSALEKFIPIQERVSTTQRSTQEALIRLKAELDAAHSACGENDQKTPDSEAAPSASASG